MRRKTGQISANSSMNSVHIPHGTLVRPLELYACKIDSL